MFRTSVKPLRSMPQFTMIFLVPAVILGCAAHASATNFFALGHLPGSGFTSHARGVSADGRTVVGWSGSRAFRWTRTDGMVSMGAAYWDSGKAVTTSASADGSMIVGFEVTSDLGDLAFRWTAEDDRLYLGEPSFDELLPGRAHAITPDATTIVGQAYDQLMGGQLPFRWTESEGAVVLGDVPNGIRLAEARAVTPDGSTIVGMGRIPGSWRAFRWTQSTGTMAMDTGLQPGIRTEANAVSADGAIVVGLMSSPTDGAQAFRWTQSTGIVGMGDLPGGSFDSVAYGISADGTKIVGRGNSVTGDEAFIWTSNRGMENLRSYLIQNNYVSESELLGWFLREARAITPDGLTIVGTGLSPQGNVEAWMARIPEPSSLVLLAFGAMLFVRQRRG